MNDRTPTLIFPDNYSGTRIPVTQALRYLDGRQDPASRFITDLLTAAELFGRPEEGVHPVEQFNELSPERQRDQVCRVNALLSICSPYHTPSGNSAATEWRRFINTYAQWIASGVSVDTLGSTGDIMHDLSEGPALTRELSLSGFDRIFAGSGPDSMEQALAALNTKMALHLGQAQEKAAGLREARR